MKFGIHRIRAFQKVYCFVHEFKCSNLNGTASSFKTVECRLIQCTGVIAGDVTEQNRTEYNVYLRLEHCALSTSANIYKYINNVKLTCIGYCNNSNNNIGV